MGTSSRRTERVLADAASKIAKAEDALQTYSMQKNMALEKKKVLEDENEKLRASILSLALQNASADLRREHVQLRQTLDSYQTKIDQMREISLLNAKVVDRYAMPFTSIAVCMWRAVLIVWEMDDLAYVDCLFAVFISRIKTKQGRQYVEYKLQIETDIRGTLVLWHRYSTFLYATSLSLLLCFIPW